MSAWLFGRRTDLLVFGGSAALALLLAVAGTAAGLDEAPTWTWIVCVLLVDVAHVHATAFRTYFDQRELRANLALYLLVPLCCYLVSVALYSEGPLAFWRVLAYVAVFHFIRQQYGWVRLYRARAGETSGAWLDTLAIYTATLYPLLYWHVQPRRFHWFVAGDFLGWQNPLIARVAFAFYIAVMTTYAVTAVQRYRLGRGTPGKDLLVGSTALCWYVGIIALDSDFAFTVTNVIVHGVPYFVLVYRHGQKSARDGWLSRVFAYGPWVLIFATWLMAYGEELLWDRAIWHEHASLFGAAWSLDAIFLVWLVPLLALPQSTHYVLDGFIWRRRHTQRIL